MKELTKRNAKESRIDRFINSQGKQTPTDYFLYSCLEYENTKQVDKKNPIARTRYPAFTEEQPELPEALAQGELSHAIKHLADWYVSINPDLDPQKPLDYESLAHIVPIIVALARDIDTLYRLRHEEHEPLPEYRAEEEHEDWKTLAVVISESFPGFAELFMRYLQWCHAPREEAPEPGSRPPVGRFVPRLGPKPGTGGRPDRGSGSRSPSGGRGKPGSRNNGRDRKEREPRGERGRNKKPTTDGRAEEFALKDALNAVRKLKADSSIDEVTLKPANSFYRRAQHQFASENGFHSYSVGGESDRAVRISRTPPSNGE